MFIEIEELKPEPLHVHHLYDAGELLARYQDAVLDQPVTIDFMLEHEGKDLHINGNLETSVRYTCSRCLKQSVGQLETAYDLVYLPHPKGVRTGEEIELKDSDMDVGFYDGLRFDVDAMAIEQIVLAMPMRFVCDDLCKGLCPTCGADLNQGSCLCKDEPGDPRMSVLKEFRRKMDE